MSTWLRLLSSSVGTKLLIALTGLAFFAFLVAHLAGNLLILAGPDAFNAYSHKLVKNPLLLVAEAGLAVIFLVHVVKAVANYVSNRRARPVRYARKTWAGYTSRKTIASSTMILSGLVILAFVIVHIRTFKFGPHYVDAAHEWRDLYRLVIEKFTHPGWVGFYVVCMAVIGMHLAHGLSSACQSLGLSHPRYSRAAFIAGRVLAFAIAGGFALIPIWVYVTGGRS